MIYLNLIFGILPSLFWLIFYLREDVNPEPKKLIIGTFILGALSTLPSLFFEILLINALSFFQLSQNLFNFLKFFLGVALVEEFFKFFVVFIFLFDHPEFNEPVDGMIYMITSALGFAAAENLLIALSITSFPELLEISFLRFLGATFIHALSSGCLGYFFALSQFKKKEGQVFWGIGLATILHGFYNFSIISIEDYWQVIFPILIVLISFFLISLFFQRLKKK